MSLSEFYEALCKRSIIRAAFRRSEVRGGKVAITGSHGILKELEDCIAIIVDGNDDVAGLEEDLGGLLEDVEMILRTVPKEDGFAGAVDVMMTLGI